MDLVAIVDNDAEVAEDINCPSIHEMFVYYDKLYFNSELGACTVEWSPRRMTRCAGICYPQAGGGCILRLSKPLLSLRPSWELKNTLIHEMIHAWLICRRISEPNGGHGKRFLAKCQEINRSTVADFLRPARGYDITVYHTMRDEVKFYQQHHWQCNVCNLLIQRAMNRKPQPADCRSYSVFRGQDCGDPTCRHHNHLKACPNGQFVKVKEPEGFSEKNTKKGKHEAAGACLDRPNKRQRSTKAITDFLKTQTNATGATDSLDVDRVPPSSSERHAEGEVKSETNHNSRVLTEKDRQSRLAWLDRLQNGDSGKALEEARTSGDHNFFRKKDSPDGRDRATTQETVIEISEDSDGDDLGQTGFKPPLGVKSISKDLGRQAASGRGQASLRDLWESKVKIQANQEEKDVATYACPICERILEVDLLEFNAHLDRCLVEEDDVIALD